MKSKMLGGLLLLALAFSALTPVTTARAAAVLTVTDTSDSNDGVCDAQCSLREAVGLAANGDSVEFAPGVTGTITLGGSQININTSITITGPGISQLTVDGNYASRIFHVSFDSLIVSISGMTITHGTVNDIGGAIHNTGTLNIDSVDFINNHAYGDYVSGGAIYNGKTLTIHNSSFIGNSAEGGGGAIASYFGTTLTVTNSVFDGNQAPGTISSPYSSGGAISVNSDTAVDNQSHVSLDHVIVKSNSAIDAGGGAFIQDGAVVTISNSAFSGNSITSTTNGIGGGIFFGNGGSAALDNVTISGNSTAGAWGGGIFNNSFALNMNNVTIANNTVTGPGGKGGGIHTGGVFNIKNSIIANNTAATGNDCSVSGTFNSQGNNLVEDTSKCNISGDTSGNITGVDPKLGALSDHGGGTLIRPLLSGSPAIDAGNDGTCNTIDQRGFPRPQGAHCDMGAFEVGAASWVVTKLEDTNDNVCDSDCSLREALAISLDGDTISFAAGLSGTITLDSLLGTLGINNSITINGPGAAILEVSGDDLVRVFIVAQDTTVRISNLTVTHGYINDDSGGGIVNDGGNLTLDHVVVSNSQAVTANPLWGNGGGIYNYGTLTITNSVITTNTASQQGGGIFNSPGSNLSVTDTVVDHNFSKSGGGLYLPNPATLTDTISLTRVSVNDNHATISGGGIFLSDSATISDSLIANNTASNGVGAGAGGGITLSEAGGLDASVTILIKNVTISGNIAFGQGGGVDVNLQQAADSVTFNNVTIANNIRNMIPGPPATNGGGGIFTAGAEYIDLQNTIVAGNISMVAGSGADCEGTINSLDYNLIQNTTNCAINGTTTHNVTGVGANLDSLADNGGPTLTMSPLAGSPALNAADDLTCIETDQRGIQRPQGAHCDIGAFEFETPAAFNKSAPANGAINQSFSPTLSWETSAGAVKYEYCYYITTTTPCSSWENNDTATSIPLSNLPGSTAYSWHVRAVNAAGETYANNNAWWSFTTHPATYIISGKAGVAGATLKYTDVTLKTATADANGNYSFTVSYDWSGTVTPSKTGYTFSPVNKSYSHVLANQSAQNYRATTSVTLYSTAAQDGWILESTETSNAGGTMNSALTTFNLGDDNLKKQYRSILSFTTSTLPDTAVITAATLKIKQYSATGGATFGMFQGLLIDILKGPFGTSALQTTDFQSAASKTGVGPFTAPAVGGWYAFNLTTSQAYINKAATGSGLTQFRLRFKLDDNNNAIANYISFYSGNALTASRPQLIIQYYVP